ncbi:hypothetical protein QR680_016591 [Steinernema hermaphroditum]|uniref:C-type lectin domain-containing protein n=1 Tax=Steinernema hermaphroditum TaxID=289476 RepID=A0AA39HDU0_9BILA|nr:hypothetical protein QR680_016591 [Steinernema hermaphroditum]
MFLPLFLLISLALAQQHPLTVMRLQHEIASFVDSLSGSKVTFDECVGLVTNTGRQHVFFAFDETTGECGIHVDMTSSSKTAALTKNYYFSVDGTAPKDAFKEECKAEVCPRNWWLFKDNRCFGLVRLPASKKTTDEAYAERLITECSARESSSTAKPASIHSKEEQDFITKKLTEEEIIAAALGLTRLPLPNDPSTNWKWADGSEVDYKHWGKNNDEDDAKRIIAIMTPDDYEWVSWYRFTGYYLCTLTMCEFADPQEDQCSV